MRHGDYDPKNIAEDKEDMCQASKILGDGTKLSCDLIRSHSGEHDFGALDTDTAIVFNPEIKTPIVNDPINPDYYQGDSVMLFIEQFQLSFCLGNTVKYIARHVHKDRLKDLKKARWYLDREIKKMEEEK